MHGVLIHNKRALMRADYVMLYTSFSVLGCQSEMGVLEGIIDELK
jgi:hypothetical protein